MYKLILLALLGISFSVNAQDHSASSNSNQASKLKALENLFSAVNSNPGNYSVTPDLSDFRAKAEKGLNSMYPSSSFNYVRCEKLTDFTLSESESLLSYFKEVYKDDLNNDNIEPDWFENIISEFIGKNCRFGIMQWEISDNGISNTVKSVVVFDENWIVLYDTQLANLNYNSESVEVSESDNVSDNNQTAAIKNQDSQNKSRTIILSNAFGSVSLFYQARITARVDPYVLGNTYDAEYHYFTEFITCTKTHISGISPDADPFLYFGTGGSFATLYQNSTPSKSPIVITGGANDKFNTGLYKISGTNGRLWSFEFDFSVDVPGGGIGITPVSNINALSLQANSDSSISMLNYLYNANVVSSDIRMVFFNGGSLDADNFKIQTLSGAGEIGKINLTSKLRAGYMAQNLAGIPVPNFWSETSTAFDFPVQYLRGNFLLQPTYKLTSTRYNIPIGQIDTLKAKITNNSHAVSFIDGDISIDVSSLNNMLTLLSPPTLPIGTIDTAASKEFKFVVRGNSNGIVTPQVNIEHMHWDSPVPHDDYAYGTASIDSNIDVSPFTKTLTLTAPVQGFYNSSTNSMTGDTLRAYLRNSSSPFAIVDSAKAYLNTSGTGTFTFSKAVNFTQYYIQTKHRNSIETWSKTPQFFINSSLTYDFSTSNTQAFGDNMIQVDASPVTYAVYSGDPNQDGLTDLADITKVFNDASNFVSGYAVSDVTGDNIVDLTDLTITYNNSSNFVSAVKP